MRAPVAQLAGAIIPRGTPLQSDQARAARRVDRGTKPKRPIDVRGRRDRILESAVPEVPVGSGAWAADPHVRFDRFPKQPALHDVDGILARLGAHALIAGLRDELRPRCNRLLNRDHFGELLHEWLLAVDVLVGAQSPQVDERVVVIGRAHNNRIELVAVLVERLAEVAAGERFRMLLRNRRERVRIDITEAREDDVGVILQLVAIGWRDRSADADLEKLEFAQLSAEGPTRPWFRKRAEERRRAEGCVPKKRGCGHTTDGGRRGGPNHVSTSQHACTLPRAAQAHNAHHAQRRNSSGP